MTKQAIDLTGKRFGYLEVIKRNGSDSSRGNALWLCKCDCGLLTTTRSSFLRKGVTKSCGCYRNKRLIKPESALKTLFFIYAKDAKKRGYEFSLDLDKFKKITKSKCFYCGVGPSLLYKHKKNISNDRGYLYNGIDRKNNFLGYTEENSVSCCKTCNYMKGSMDFEEWNLWIERISILFLNKQKKLLKYFLESKNKQM